MGKVLSWLVLIALAWAVVKFIAIAQRKAQARQQERAAARPSAADAGRAQPAAPASSDELMVRCDHCGIYLPQSESLAGAGHRYCSPAHREAGPRPPGRLGSDA